ncbi:hypothetical protein WN944_010659 [Citrus x changshan-huyou]|uniref:Uncharacterized protein n=1 Tax=Citrus x changshan-huyou TaxID=2935761 RepID=A0AAP0MS41_9ROSI
MTRDDEDGDTCFGLMACLLLSFLWLVVVALKRGWGTEGGSCHMDLLMVECIRIACTSSRLPANIVFCAIC